MKILIILSLLSGWLVTEIKDFILIGGVQNHFAFILLKIIFIATASAICIVMVTGPPLIMQTFERCFQTFRYNMQTPNGDLPKKDTSVPKRINNFIRSSSNHST